MTIDGSGPGNLHRFDKESRLPPCASALRVRSRVRPRGRRYGHLEGRARLGSRPYPLATRRTACTAEGMRGRSLPTSPVRGATITWLLPAWMATWPRLTVVLPRMLCVKKRSPGAELVEGDLQADEDLLLVTSGRRARVVDLGREWERRLAEQLAPTLERSHAVVTTATLDSVEEWRAAARMAGRANGWRVRTGFTVDGEGVWAVRTDIEPDESDSRDAADRIDSLLAGPTRLKTSKGARSGRPTLFPLP